MESAAARFNVSSGKNRPRPWEKAWIQEELPSDEVSGDLTRTMDPLTPKHSAPRIRRLSRKLRKFWSGGEDDDPAPGPRSASQASLPAESTLAVDEAAAAETYEEGVARRTTVRVNACFAVIYVALLAIFVAISVAEFVSRETTQGVSLVKSSDADARRRRLSSSGRDGAAIRPE